VNCPHLAGGGADGSGSTRAMQLLPSENNNRSDNLAQTGSDLPQVPMELNNTLLNHQLVIEEIREETKNKFLEFSKNENTTYQNLWDTTKVDLKSKLIAMSAYIKRTEKSQMT
jgi:hypothetical protein